MASVKKYLDAGDRAEKRGQRGFADGHYEHADTLLRELEDMV